LAKRSWEPRSYPTRDPRTGAQMNGRVLNPARALKLGGKGETRIVDAGKFPVGTAGPSGVGPTSDRGGGGKR